MAVVAEEAEELHQVDALPPNEGAAPPQKKPNPLTSLNSSLQSVNPHDLLDPAGPVGGILQAYWPDWERLGAHKWVVGILREGYRVQFKNVPSLSTEPINPSGYADEDRNELIALEIQKLIAKGAIEEVPKPGAGHYSRLFLRPKASGGLRPILDLSLLNKEIVTPKFRQETVESIRRSLKKDHWTFSIDLKDAFFQVPVHVKSRRFLRFLFRGIVYQYKVLPFGMAPSPYVFTRVVVQVKEMLQKQGHQLFQFLDDWLGQSPVRDLAAQRASTSVELCRELGLVLNPEKSELVPQQEFDYVGMHVSLRDYTVSVTERNVSNILERVAKFLTRDVWTAREWQSLLGVLQSQCQYMAQGNLYLRPLQFHLKSQWRQLTGDPKDPVKLSLEVRETLDWWLVRDHLKEGVPITPPPHTLQVFTDASKKGWGGYSLKHGLKDTYSGDWSQEEKSLHINALEMRAVALVLSRMDPPEGTVILVASDNATVVAYINRQGGTISWTTWLELRKLLLLARERGWMIRARHIAGCLNVLADRLSRKGEIFPTEWSLHPDIVSMMFQEWGTPQVDLFATWENHKCMTFVSPFPDDRALSSDSLNISWEGMTAYAFPPRAILGKVLLKVRQTKNLRLILVAPDWAKQTWYGDLREMAAAGPLKLPPWRCMLKQPHGNLYHYDPDKMGLCGWLVVRDACSS